MVTDTYVDGGPFFSKDMINSGYYNPRKKIEWDLRVSANNKIKAIETSGLISIEHIPDYEEKLEQFKSKYLKCAIYDVLGAAPIDLGSNYIPVILIEEFFTNMSDKMLIESYLGNEKAIDSFIDGIVLSENFLMKYIWYPKVLKIAKEYVEKCVLTDDEKMLTEFLSKTKQVKTFLFQVETTAGYIMKCFNRVDTKGGKWFSTQNIVYGCEKSYI